MRFRVKAMGGSQDVLSYVLDAIDEADARRQVAGAGLAFISIARERSFSFWGRATRIALVNVSEDLGSELPFASRMLMRWGQFLDAHGYAVALGAIAAVAGIAYAFTRPAVRAAIGARIARIPALGSRLHIYQLARLYRTVGMLQRGGTPMVTAMRMSAGLLSANLRAAFASATQAVRQGRSMGDAMEQYGLTTPVAARMLRVGERSGNMGEMMEGIAAFYAEELSRWVNLATRLIEPALMSLIGIIIGVIVVLMYFPIFELARSIK